MTNTFAVDKKYRTPYAGTWNASIQHEFGGRYFGEIAYLGTKGTRLDVRTLPNELSPGSPQSNSQQNQFGNASGFTYDQSVGNSIFHALQLRLNRRFNRGVSFSLFYQFAKSIDDSSTFGGAGNTVAQNWLDISAERGLSSFDVRHEFTGNLLWTSPVAAPGSHIAAESRVARLLKDWQLSGSITAQTGNPLTARVLGNTQQLAQTGGVGKGRAEATGEALDTGSGFFNLNAFTVPGAGVYGDAGRNTNNGPWVVQPQHCVCAIFYSCRAPQAGVPNRGKQRFEPYQLHQSLHGGQCRQLWPAERRGSYALDGCRSEIPLLTCAPFCYRW